MNEQKRALENFSVLNDDPLFWLKDSFDPNLDTFNHEAYARAILKILTENTPPISIGLFGPWGIGKSTIVSILFKLIAQENNKKLKPIYFNAWKYSGDSFRRQFLIDVARQVYEGHSERDAKIKRLEQLNYTDVLREDAQKGLVDQIKELLRSNVRLREPGLARILLALVVLLVGGGVALFAKSIYPLLWSIFAALLFFFLRLKFEDVFVIKENTVYDPKLMFPEQFEAEFRKLVDPSGPLNASTPVVVVDDIDRCEAATIRDILISIKTFIGQENCFFIVPCDDRSVVGVFQDPNQESGYRDELLRKYFNVGVRIAPLMATDLVDFANSVSKGTGMPASVVQIAILANYRDARKMKHFLNTFAVKYSIAKARKKSGFMPIDIDQTLPGFAKAVLIEDLYPDLFARMVEHPEIYGILERAALGGDGVEELKKADLSDWMEAYPRLRGILQKTRHIKIEHVEVFLSLKTTNPEARIPRGFELKNSIVQGDETGVEETLKGISTEQSRMALAELLIDLLGKTTEMFLKNTISVSLNCYSNEDLLAPSDKPRIARALSHALDYDQGQRVLQQRASYALQCATDAGGDFLRDLLHKYQWEIQGLDQPPEGLEETINALYQHMSQPSALSALLNKKVEHWMGGVTGDKEISLLTKIQLPKDLKKEDIVPSQPLLKKIAATIAPDDTPTSLAGNNLRRQVLFKNWDIQVAPSLAERLVAILQAGQSDPTYAPRVKFVIGTIILQPEVLESKYSSQLWGLTQQLFAQATDANAKIEIHQAILVFAAKCPVITTRTDAKNVALLNWQRFTDEELRKVISYLEAFQDPERKELQTSLIKQELTLAQNELQNPTERTRQRLDFCFEQRQLISPKSVDSFLLKTLETPDNAFAVWRVTVASYSVKLENDFSQQVAERCLSLVTGSHTQPRRQAFFELFATVLPAVDPTAKPHLLQNYFALCKHADSNLRNPAATILGKIRKEVDEQDFKLGLNTLVRDFCRMAPSEVGPYRPILDAALAHSALFSEYEWRDLADLGKRSIQQADSGLQDYGLSLIERMPRVPPEHEEDIIHSLIGIVRGTNVTQKERADKFLRKVQVADLGAKAAKALQEYLAPPKQEDKASS
jgi:hypothetical protein